MALMTATSTLSPAYSSSTLCHDEIGAFQTFNGLRRQHQQLKLQTLPQRRREIAAGVVLATSLRPRRFLKEEGGLIPVSPEDGRINYIPGEVMKVRNLDKERRILHGRWKEIYE